MIRILTRELDNLSTPPRLASAFNRKSIATSRPLTSLPRRKGLELRMAACRRRLALLLDHPGHTEMLALAA